MEFFSAIFGVAIYFAPTIVAYFRRDKANLAQVAVINTLLGWTVIGWIVALVLALGDPTKGQQAINVHVNTQVGEGHTYTTNLPNDGLLQEQPAPAQEVPESQPVTTSVRPGRPGWKAD